MLERGLADPGDPRAHGMESTHELALVRGEPRLDEKDVHALRAGGAPSHGAARGAPSHGAVAVTPYDPRMNGIVLLGPQRLKPTLAGAVAEVGVEGPIATITAGWEEREQETDELARHLETAGAPKASVVNLRLYGRAEELLLADPAVLKGWRERRARLRELHALYAMRLSHAMRALRALAQRNGSEDLLRAEREDALATVRALDAHHLRRVHEVQQEADDRMRVHEHETIGRHRAEIAEHVRTAAAVAIAGGNVAILLNRMRLFALAPALEGRPLFAWSAGAMALGEQVVLFHDRPPQGAGHPELLGAGLGLVRGILPLPHARRRLRLDDRERVAGFARRFAPFACVALDDGCRLRVREEGARADEGCAWRLSEHGALEPFAA
jgi:peptidase E